MAMAERAAPDFVRAAQRRLTSARVLYGGSRTERFEDAFLEMADVAMLVWSAGIDTISAHMRAHGESDLGTSARRRRYLRSNVEGSHSQVELRVGWGHLVRLHNFKHNMEMEQVQFEEDCRASGQFIQRLNQLLPPTLRLPSDAYAWLAEVG